MYYIIVVFLCVFNQAMVTECYKPACYKSVTATLYVVQFIGACDVISVSEFPLCEQSEVMKIQM